MDSSLAAAMMDGADQIKQAASKLGFVLAGWRSAESWMETARTHKITAETSRLDDISWSDLLGCLKDEAIVDLEEALRKKRNLPKKG